MGSAEINAEFKSRVNSGERIAGIFVKSGSPAMVEIIGYSGFDYALLDMEHSPVSIEQLENLIRAAETAGTAPMVRVSGISEPEILHPLDKGAAGLLVPMVNTPEMAEEVVRYAKYAPQGERGIDIYARSAKYSTIPKSRYFEQANSSTVIAVQIEGSEGLANVAEIAAVEAIDVVYVGPYDLSQSLGIPGQIDDPRVAERIEKIAADVKACGKGAGIYVDDVPTALKYFDLGIQFITLSVDATIFLRACETLRKELV